MILSGTFLRILNPLGFKHPESEASGLFYFLAELTENNPVTGIMLNIEVICFSEIFTTYHKRFILAYMTRT